MEARFTARQSVQLEATSRRWRRCLAALISVAFVLSFFHGLSFDGLTFDGDDGVPTTSIAQGASDITDKAPAHPAPLHGDHCLTHLSSVTPQETAIAIEYVAHGYRIVSMQSLDGALLRSPFEPPRA
ncbi:MAG: hypothetical protein ABI561_01030 [Bradyrhizobium sp.]